MNNTQIVINRLLARYPDIFAKAYALATEAHKDDVRSNGDPYMTHVDAVIIGSFRIAFRYIETQKLKTDCIEEIITVAALHDVCEDHPDTPSLSDVEKMFLTNTSAPLEAVCRIIQSVSAITKKPRGEELYGDYVTRVSTEAWSSIVKLADLSHNMSDLNPGNLLDKYDITYCVISAALHQRFGGK